MDLLVVELAAVIGIVVFFTGVFTLAAIIRG
jgi:hypothetical protein